MILDEVFEKSTIITVAHRIRTILNYDLVAVMDKGVVVEIGPPGELILDANSAFARLAGDSAL